MREQTASLSGHLQSIVAIATAGVMVWSDSFEVAGESFLGLAGIVAAVGWFRQQRVRLAERERVKGIERLESFGVTYLRP